MIAGRIPKRRWKAVARSCKTQVLGKIHKAEGRDRIGLIDRRRHRLVFVRIPATERNRKLIGEMEIELTEEGVSLGIVLIVFRKQAVTGGDEAFCRRSRESSAT